MSDLHYVTWTFAIAEARAGRPQMLAGMVVSGPIPEDLKLDVELVIAHPKHSPGGGGRKPAIDPEQASTVRRYFMALTTDDPEKEWSKWTENRAIQALAEAYDVDPKTIRNILAGKPPYGPKPRKLTRR